MAKGYVGGYGIGARVIMEHTLAGADPLGPESMLGIGISPFTGCGTISTSRFITMGKSPLTGYWADANSGGNFPAALKASGYDFVFLEGAAEAPGLSPCQRRGGSRNQGCPPSVGKGYGAAREEMIRAENGNRALKVVCIGTAGEKRQPGIAALINERRRTSSCEVGPRGSHGLEECEGPFACAGSKQAWTSSTEGNVESLNREMIKEIRDNPTGPMTQVVEKNSGTPGAMMPHLAHALCLTGPRSRISRGTT